MKSRRRLTDDPIDFGQIKNKQGATRWRCNNVQYNHFHKEFRRCSVTYKKKDCKKHICRFDIPKDKDIPFDIPAKYNRIAQSRNDVQLKINYTVAKFVASSSLSASVGCSLAMTAMVQEICKIAVETYRNLPNKSNCDFTKIINNINACEIKECIEKVGDEAFEILCNELNLIGHVNLMIDAATILNKKVVHSTINNPFSLMAPVPFRTIEKVDSDWGEAEYENEILEGLKFCSEIGLTPVAICHDRLPAQAIAVKKALQIAQTIDPKFCLVVDVPCINHVLHNCFIHSMKKSQDLKHMIDEIDQIAKYLRSHDVIQILKKKCPLYPQTRWLYIVDTIAFIRRNQEIINSIRARDWEMANPPNEGEGQGEYLLRGEFESALPGFIEDLYVIFKPLKAASLCFECEQSRLSDVIPVIFEVYKFYEKVVNEYSFRDEKCLEILHVVLAQLTARISILIPDEAFLSWSLTRSGRYYLRKWNEKAKIVVAPITDTPEQFLSNDVSDDIKNLLASIIDDNNNEEEEEFNDKTLDEDLILFDNPPLIPLEKDDEPEIQNENINVHKKEIETELIIVRNADNESNVMDSIQILEEITQNPEVSDDDKEMAESEISLQKQINILIDEQMKLNISEQTNYDIRADSYRKSLPIISKFLNILGGVNETEAKKQFDQWLFLHNDDFEDVLKVESDLEMWQEIHKRYHYLSALALAAIWLISVATSESDVERLNSMHKFLVHDRMTNISIKNLLARLRTRSLEITKKSYAKIGKTSIYIK